jgi:SAM-dependent methyltransferase
VSPAVAPGGITSYDLIAYPSRAMPQTHPDRLATHARLFGLTTAPIDACRVLDIGGGDGSNLISLALAFPNSRFVSFDLAKSPVERGQATIEALGVTNFDLFQGNISDVDLGDEPFDYVISHGVYSWIPETARDALLALVRRSLAPRGIAFVSYNTLPGCHLRQILREILLYQVRDLTDPDARVEAAQAYLGQIVDGYPDRGLFQALLKAEAGLLRERRAGSMAHDEMGEIYNPVYFHQFMAHAARHGLKFLTEAESVRAGQGFPPPSAYDDPNFDIIAYAQEGDFKAICYFRQTLLTHEDVSFSRRAEPTRLLDLQVSSAASRTEKGDFELGEVRFDVTDERLGAIVDALGAAWPSSLPVRDLIDTEEYAAALLRMYLVGTVALHMAPQHFVAEAGERPQASALARLQAKSGASRLTTLRHDLVNVDDAFSREFIAELDGSRTRAELARDIGVRLGASIDEVTPLLETNLGALARMPILVG